MAKENTLFFFYNLKQLLLKQNEKVQATMQIMMKKDDILNFLYPFLAYSLFLREKLKLGEEGHARHWEGKNTVKYI